MNVLLPKNINVDKIKYSELKIMKSGAKSVYLNYSGSKINIQTPVLNIPYGVNDNMQYINKDASRKDEDKKYDITVSFKGIDENSKIKLFHDKMKELEEKIINDAFDNRLVWFKNNFGGNKDIVANMFTPIVKRDKDKVSGDYADKYPPTFKAKIPYNANEDKFEFDSYDMDNNEINFSEYAPNLKGGKAQFIIQLNGIWFAAGIFGCSWKIVSGKFQQINTTKVTFVPDSDDEVVDEEEEDEDIYVDYVDNTLLHVKEPVVEPVKTVLKTDEKVDKVDKVDKIEKVDEEDEEEDDDEEDDEEEEEVVVEPVVVEEPVKKKAVKKVTKK